MGLVRNVVHGTDPGLVHAPNAHRCPWWRFVVRETFGEPRSFADCEDLVILTWNSGASNADPGERGHVLGMFERSLSHAGVSVRQLGGGVGGAWVNRMKLTLTLESLRNEEKPYVLAGDSTDVLLLESPGEILARFRQSDASMLFNAEKNFWPPECDALRCFEEETGPGPFMYLNSGLWIGETSFVRVALERALDWSERLTDRPRSDQVCWKYAYRDLYPQVALDHRCEIFQNLTDVDDEITVGQRRLRRGLFGWTTRRA